MSIVRRMLEQRDQMGAPWLDPNRIPRPSELGATWSGVHVTETTALQVVTVMTCVSILADTLSSLPIAAFRKAGGERRPVNPDPALILSPHAELDWPTWMGQMVASLKLRGNAYGWITNRDRNGYATDVLPLHPDLVRPQRNKDSGLIEYRLTGDKQPVSRLDMVHVRGLTLPGALVGCNPIEYARHAIGLAIATERFGERFFGEGTSPMGVLESDDELTPTTALALQATWRHQHGQGSRAPAVLGNGLKWKPISIAPEDSQFLETRKYSRSEIAGLYRVPPHMIGDVERSTSWGTGIEEQSLGFVTFGIGSDLVRFESALSRLLPRPQYVKFNVASLLRGRLIDRFEAYGKGLSGGWLSIDDVRAIEDQAPLPDGLGAGYNLPMDHRPVQGLSRKEQIDAVAVLVRAGYDPAAACAAVGLPAIDHTGTIPVTVQLPDGKPTAA